MNLSRCQRLAVTGGIASGKSAGGRALESLGVPVIDTDTVAHTLLAADAEVLREIRDRFGDAVFSDDSVDRKKLGRVVFADAEARRDLEKILHPRIREAVRRWFLLPEIANRPVAAALVPLVYEAGWSAEFDRVACVACSPAVQRARLRERGLSEEAIDQRLTAQMPVEEKVALADVVIWSDGPLERQTEQWRAVLEGMGAV